jgi:2-(1,2-epoxy-1,2-dihydrophenyl)acetyl-CoA isomerase
VDDELLRTIDDSVLTLTLNRPAQLNAMTWRMMRLLHEALADAAADPGVRAIVLRGSGRAFCSGGDLRGAPDTDDPIAERWSGDPVWRSYEQRVAQLSRFTSSAIALHEMPKPTIAMIQGPVAGAGLCLAAGCDFRIVSEDAVFTTAFVRAHVQETSVAAIFFRVWSAPPRRANSTCSGRGSTRGKPIA